jgi:hypothetical protein
VHLLVNAAGTTGAVGRLSCASFPGVNIFKEWDGEDGVTGKRADVTSSIVNTVQALLLMLIREFRGHPDALAVFQMMILQCQIHLQRVSDEIGAEVETPVLGCKVASGSTLSGSIPMHGPLAGRPTCGAVARGTGQWAWITAPMGLEISWIWSLDTQDLPDWLREEYQRL